MKTFENDHIKMFLLPRSTVRRVCSNCQQFIAFLRSPDCSFSVLKSSSFLQFAFGSFLPSTLARLQLSNELRILPNS
nr:hypothetical transcript [Hymenolepis microstoma]